MTGVRVTDTRVETSQVMTPNDANFLGKVFGGTILSLIDLVAYATATRFAGNICVTASFDKVDFLEPIEVGELVTMVGHVSYVGRTSVQVRIEVSAENVYTRARRSTNIAWVTMVAVKDGKPVEVPRLICETREEKLRYLEGKMRKERRAAFRAELERELVELETLSDPELDAVVVAAG
ncbi:MAG TPA: acyl-CoA thioesterase [Fimbriimonadaceae bacterium]|nr:acyl-CoA thioesterase [Fimbriimonadaceae bacterium]